jgi:hypothetical protein
MGNPREHMDGEKEAGKKKRAKEQIKELYDKFKANRGKKELEEGNIQADKGAGRGMEKEKKENFFENHPQFIWEMRGIMTEANISKEAKRILQDKEAKNKKQLSKREEIIGTTST